MYLNFVPGYVDYAGALRAPPLRASPINPHLPLPPPASPPATLPPSSASELLKFFL